MKKFETEEYYAKYEFTKPHQISVSDCESVSIEELIRLGGGSTQEFLNVKLGYPEMQGSHGLRSEIASTYTNINAEQVLVLGSPIEGIYLALTTLVAKGEHVIVLSPAYDALYNVAEHATGNVSRWFLKQEGGAWHLDFAALEKQVTSKTKLLVVNFPHNPTGYLPTHNELEKLVEIADSRGIRIFIDEIYRGLEIEVPKLPSLAEINDKAVVLSGASKTLGMPGLRFGWLITKDPDAYKKLYDYKTYTSMCATQAGEYLGIMTMRAAPKLTEKNLAIVKKNCAIAEKFFATCGDRYQWLKPRGGSISLMKIDVPSAEKFCTDLADRFGVVLLPAKFMGYEDKYARLGLGRNSFESGLKAFQQALATL